MSRARKILILSASAGAGHLRAAEAIEKAWRRTDPPHEIRNLDTLQFTNKPFRKLYSEAYIDLVNKAPELLGWLYDHLDKPWHHERRRLAFSRLNTGRFKKLLEEYQPDLAVCTHFLPAEIIGYLRREGRIRTRQVITVTDFDVHAMWLCRECDHYFVAMEETREHLAAMGISRASISVSGIPIDPVFAEPRDKAATRAAHGLDPDRVTLLISAGGFGVGPIEHLMTSLLKLEHPVQIVAVCGRSEQLKAKVESAVAGAGGNVKVKVIGYTRQMDELMTAADIVVGKPGGLTTSEALAKGLAFVIVNPIPGQEERNADHLLEEGSAIRCNNLPALAWKLDRLLADPARLAAMRDASRRLGRPTAAADVVATLERMLD